MQGATGYELQVRAVRSYQTGERLNSRCDL